MENLSASPEATSPKGSLWKKAAPLVVVAALAGFGVECCSVLSERNAQRQRAEDAESEGKYRAYKRKFWRALQERHDALAPEERQDRTAMHICASALEAGDIDDALALTTEFIERNAGEPGREKKFYSAEAHQIRGKTHFARGDTDSAIADMRRSIALYGKFARPHYLLAHYYKSAGRDDEAEVYFEKGVSIQPLENFLIENPRPVLKATEKYPGENEHAFVMYWGMKKENDFWQALEKEFVPK